MSASTFFTCLSASGHMGLPMTQGSTITVVPSLVSMRKVACPSHVIRLPFRSIVSLNHQKLECVAFAPVAISAGERKDVAKAHLLEIDRGQRGAAAASAVQNEFAVLVGCDLVDVHFQNAARQFDRARNRAFRLLVAFAHVDQREILP